MKATTPLWIRMLGYGGTALFIAAAVGVLAFQVLQGGHASGRARAGATGSAPAASGGAPESPGATAAPTDQGAGGGTGTGGSGGGQGGDPAGGNAAGPLTGATRCGASTASYQRAGDTIRVTVSLPPTGVVSASVVMVGSAQPETKALDVQGQTGTHTFEFTGKPAAKTQSVSVTVLSSTGFQTCALGH